MNLDAAFMANSVILDPSISTAAVTIVYPSTTLRNLYIESSTNVNFMTVGMDKATLKNAKLVNTSYNDTTIEFPPFYFRDGNRATVTNVTSQNHRGPMFRINDILIVNVYNCSFNESKASKNLTSQNQIFMDLSRHGTTLQGSTITEDQMITIFDNFNLYVLFMYLSSLDELGLYRCRPNH